ncbi:hypothetical protein I2486_20025 [Cellulophaga sp. E16_2]|uniref:DUF6702 family protein n=1 Tax=unclassified Cellulophaga TaxID=2634405 RepID=UPI0013FD1FB7|nr:MULTISPECIES: DUF6702 family protein [unclassified Cellulophaga]MBO0593694.1 hypothetical protein [Cellulophaga sp. E16_2]
MYKILIALFFVSLSVQAHQADASTVMLVEQDNGSWVLQISGALTAFQHEIKTMYPEKEYKTPEEFKQMVIDHVQNNLSFLFNDKVNYKIKSAQVKLGHETKVVFELSGIPENLKNVVVKNTIFKEIYKNQSTLLLFKNGFTKTRFVLNNENQHTLNLKVEEHSFISAPTEGKRDYSTLYVVGSVVFLLGVVNYFWMSYKEKKPLQVVKKS